MDPSKETEVSSDLLAQTVWDTAHWGGKRNIWDVQEGGLQQTCLEGTGALLYSL